MALLRKAMHPAGGNHGTGPSGLPNFSQHPSPILSKNKANLLVRVSASYESSREIVDPFLSFKTGDDFVRAMDVVARVSLGEAFREHCRRTQIVALDSCI